MLSAQAGLPVPAVTRFQEPSLGDLPARSLLRPVPESTVLALVPMLVRAASPASMSFTVQAVMSHCEKSTFWSLVQPANIRLRSLAPWTFQPAIGVWSVMPVQPSNIELKSRQFPTFHLRRLSSVVMPVQPLKRFARVVAEPVSQPRSCSRSSSPRPTQPEKMSFISWALPVSQRSTPVRVASLPSLAKRPERSVDSFTSMPEPSKEVRFS